MVLKNFIKCYLCSRRANNGIDIFGPKGIKLLMASILTQHFGFQLTESNCASKTVCRKCWQITDQFHKLYCSVAENQNILQQNSQLKSELPNITNPLTSNVEIKYENELNIQQDDTSSNVAAESSAPYLKIEDFLETKTEDSIPELIEAKLPEKIVVHPVTDIIGNVRKVRGTYTKREKKTTRCRTIRTDEQKADHRSKLLSEDKEIESFIGIHCDVCGRREKSYIALRRHFRTEHLISGYMKCCNKKFFRRTKLLTHIKDHNFPDKYRCELCNRSYTDKECLVRHMKIHDPAYKSFQCVHCPRRFERKTLLDNHIYERHSNAPKSFECDICNKTFVTKDNVYNHILAVHANKYSKICDLCAQIFKSQALLEQHYAIKHMGMQTPKAQCNVCGTWVNKRNLRHHLARHEGLGATCSICGKQSLNKVALRNHILYVHGGRSFQCNYCDKSFKSRVTLREHIGSHTGFSMYKCSYCPMEFKSGANMYKHRKKIHPNEWLEDRRKRLETKSKSH